MNEQMFKMLCGVAGIQPEKAAAIVQEVGNFVQGLSPALATIAEQQTTIINQQAEMLEILRAQHDNNSGRTGRRKLANGASPGASPDAG